MTIDDRQLAQLIEESNDLHVDAMRGIHESIPVLTEIREERRRDDIDTDEIDRFNAGRRSALKKLGLGAGGIAARGALYGSMGSLFTGLLAAPAHADKNLDVQILQTASSLERLAVNTYDAALDLNFIAERQSRHRRMVIVAFATTTMTQHDEHRQGVPGPDRGRSAASRRTHRTRKFHAVVEPAVPNLKAPLDVVTWPRPWRRWPPTPTCRPHPVRGHQDQGLMGSVMGVEAQHLATLRAVKALLDGGGPRPSRSPSRRPGQAARGRRQRRLPRRLRAGHRPDDIAQPDTGARQ